MLARSAGDAMGIKEECQEAFSGRTLCSALASFLMAFSSAAWACSSPWQGFGE